MGDPSGFYYPLSKELTVLRVNRQMRQEALPLAYQRTIFRVEMDDLVKLLIAVGRIGRENIKNLDLVWESQADIESQLDDASLSLPTLHAARCVQLLKRCKRLDSVEISFDTSNTFDDFKTNPGIRELCSCRGIKHVGFWENGESLEHLDQFKWLKKEMESSGRMNGREESWQTNL
jgi:hypothetical protein